MHMKKVTKKDRYGNQTSYEFEVPEKPLDPTTIITKQMELDAEMAVPEMMMMTMESMMPPVMGEEFNMGDPNNHPGEPMGSDTVPAWLTPGEFVVNKEATEMFGPEIEAMNEAGKMMKGGMVDGYNRGGNVRGSAAQIFAGKDPADLVRMLGTLGNAYQYVAPALGLNEGGFLGYPSQTAYVEAAAKRRRENPPDFADTPEQRASDRFLSDPYTGIIREAWHNLFKEEGGEIPMPVPMLDALLHSREGYRPDVYLDSLGKPTVGAGHLLPDSYKAQVGERPFTEAQLDEMFIADRDKAAEEAKSNVGEEAWNKLNKRQQATMASMAFQLGGAGQRKFKNLLNAVKAGDHREVAKQALTGSKGGRSLWLKQTPVRALDLAEAFDPEIAAQYRAAGGQVYDDSDAMYAFWGTKVEPTPEINWQGSAGMLSDLINSGYTPEQAIAAVKNIEAGEEVVPIEGDLAAPPTAAPLEGDTVAKHAEEDVIDDFLWGAAHPLDPFGFTRPEEEGGNEITWTDVGDVVLGDKGREAAGLPPLPTDHSSIGADWWKGERLKEAEAAQALEDMQDAYAEEGGVGPDSVRGDMMKKAEEAGIPPLEGLGDEAAFGAGSYDSGELTDEDLLRQYKQVDDVIAADDEEVAKGTQEIDKALTPAEQQLKRNEIMAKRWAGMAKAIEADPKVAQLMAGKTPEEIAQAGEQQLKADETITDQVRSYLEESPLGKEIGGALGSFFNAAELTKMAVYVAGSMAFGASPMDAMNFGVKQYLQGLSAAEERKSAAAAGLQKQAFEAAKTGKFTQQSIAAFQKSGNPAVLVSTDGKDPMLELAKTGKFTRESMAAYQKSGNPLDLQLNSGAWTSKEREKQIVELQKEFTDASIAQYMETGNPIHLTKTVKPKNPQRTGQKVWVQGLGNTEVWTDASGQQVFRQKNGSWAPLSGTAYGNYDKATMGDAAIESRASQHISELEGVANQGIEKGDEGYINIPNTQLASEYNRIFQQQLKGVADPERSQSVIKERMDEATQVWMDQYTTAVRNGTKKPTIDALEGIYESAIVARNNNISASALYGTSPHNQTLIEDEMKKDPAFSDSSTQQVYQTAFAAWGRVPEGEQEKYAQRAEKLGGYSPFMLFMRELLDGNSKAESYLLQ